MIMYDTNTVTENYKWLITNISISNNSSKNKSKSRYYISKIQFISKTVS